MGITSYTFNLIIYRIVLSNAFIYLMAIATILRILPFTKYFANTILVIGISFLIVYPVALMFETHFFQIKDYTSFHITDYTDELEEGKAIIPRMYIARLYTIEGDGTLITKTQAGTTHVVVNYPELVKYYAYAMISSVFMIPLNILLIIATVKALLRYFGEYDSIIDMYLLGMGG